MGETEKQTAAWLDRIVEVSSQSVVARHEQRIPELERERLVLAERLEAQARPRKSFGEMFELALGVLANSYKSWGKGTLGMRHAVL